MRGCVEELCPETQHDVLVLLLLHLVAAAVAVGGVVGVVAGLSPRDRTPWPTGRLQPARTPQAAGPGTQDMEGRGTQEDAVMGHLKES